MASIAQLNKLIEKTGDYDKDERYMATNDLCALLSKDVKIDESMEKKICTAILKQLDDKSNDVQSVAVKCLAVIIKKVQIAQISEISDKLCNLILNGQNALRDIYSIGLKTLILDVPDKMGAAVSNQLTRKLLSGISQHTTEEVKRECLDNLAELLRRFGSHCEKDHSAIMSAVIDELDSDKQIVRKRSRQCLGSLAVVSSESLLNEMIQKLIDKIYNNEKKAGSSQETRTLIQTIGTISGMVGYRLGRHLDSIIPLFIKFCGDPFEESQQNDASNELREHCFPGLESFVLRCPREVTPFLSEIIKVAVAFMKYDPNYTYDDDCDGDADMDQDEDADDDEEYEEAYAGSDDDDSSWKVRKAAVKVLAVIITARPELQNQLYESCGDDLLGRFKEREENVRLDIINCYALLIKSSSASGALMKDGDYNTSVTATAISLSPVPLKRQRSCVNLLEERVSIIVTLCCSQLAQSSLKTKSAVFHLLQALVCALKGGLGSHLGSLIGATAKCLQDKNQAMKLDALVFLRLAFEKHPAVVVQPFVPKIFDQVSSTMSEDWYKIVSEVLRLLGTIVDVMRPIDSSSGFFIAGFDYQILAPKIYKLLLPRLEASDIDQEIKECAILTAGKLFASTADVLGSELDTVLHLLQKKLENETTRIAVLKTLIILSKSPLCLDLSKVLISSANEMAMYLRQQSRVLRQLTLQTLDLLVLGSKADIGEISSTILAATAALINDSDLYLCQLAMKLSFSALSKNTLVLAAPFYDNVYPALIALARSSLLKGISLETLANTLRQLVSLNLPGMTFIDLFSGLYLSVSNESLSGNTLEKQGLTTSSKCVAAITIDLSEPVSTETIQKFASDLLASNDTVNQLALLCLGEVGQLRDLSSLAGLKEVILQCFENPCEETKLCAAYALGHISVGNMKEFLPVVTQPSTSSKHQYLLLVSLKEIILFYANRNLEFSAYLNLVLPILLMQCKSSEESVRNMVAECLGLLLAINSQQMLSVLLQLLQESQDNFSRSMVAGAVRVCLSRPLHCDTVTLISEVIANFLTLLHDSDLEVKKAALLMVNAAVHHNAEVLITQLSSSVLPVLIETLKIKMERTVDFGPFKHKVDDNLPLRKVSLTCVESILEAMPERLDLTSIMTVLPLLLNDTDDIQLLSHQILTKLVNFSPGVVVGFLGTLIEPLGKTINKGAKEGATIPEVERANELIKSAVRVVLTLKKVDEEGSSNRSFSEFTEKVINGSQTRGIVEEIELEKNLTIN